MITGTITFLGFTMQTYEMSVIGSGVIAAIFILAPSPFSTRSTPASDLGRSRTGHSCSPRNAGS